MTAKEKDQCWSPKQLIRAKSNDNNYLGGQGPVSVVMVPIQAWMLMF
jgi:hypothetical protein